MSLDLTRPTNVFKDAKKKNIRTSPFFDIFKYVETFDDIEVKEDSKLKGFESGKIEYKDGIFIITINEYHPEIYKRFTLAHEFGHYCLHKSYLIEHRNLEDGVLFKSDLANDEKESDANDFAAIILMKFENFVKDVNDGFNTIKKIAERFRVPEEAAIYRAKMIKMID